jgi:hypothetical protein
VRVSALTARCAHSAEGLPGGLSTRIAAASLLRKRTLNTAASMPRRRELNRHGRAPNPRAGEGQRQGEVVHDAFKERRQERLLQTRGREAGFHAWGRTSRRTCDGHSPKSLLISRLQGRSETHRPLISLGYGRLKPNPVGRQRLRSTIFPFGPLKKIKAMKSFYEEGDRIPREPKSPPSVVLR